MLQTGFAGAESDKTSESVYCN